MEDENIVLARRWFEEVWNQRRTDTIDELLYFTRPELEGSRRSGI